jgi:lysophospholipase L1-like esterase
MKFRGTLSIFVCVLLLAVSFETPAEGTDFYLNDGDRVVFYGDSITEQSFYTNFVETYVVTRYPRLNVSFTNSGWSGDWIVGGGGGKIEERLRRDVFAYKPTVMTAMLGMNDGCYMELNVDCLKVYTEGYEKFLKLVKNGAPNARLTLLQPSPYDDITGSHAWRLAPSVKGGYNPVMVRFGQFVRELAEKNKLKTADMNKPLLDVITSAQKVDSDLAQKIIPDRIHPGAAGGLVMAATLLKSWNAPVIVSGVNIDVAGKKIVSAENAKISETKFEKEISWTQNDEALPLPLDNKDKALVLTVFLTNIVDLLNRQMLTITGLNAAKYKLRIDGEALGEWTREEFAKGINLAVLPTPMAKQAAEVHRLTELHNKLHYTRWRAIQVPLDQESLSETAKALSDMDALEAEVVKRQRAAAQPKPHRFELTAN